MKGSWACVSLFFFFAHSPAGKQHLHSYRSCAVIKEYFCGPAVYAKTKIQEDSLSLNHETCEKICTKY